ncbi:unnamed protein product [Effrenium voratum]|nr:unnamed protein product [Effrenium voratum]CAJ1440409.1 unnamed protein product [Effrenium voratum]
MDIEKELPKDMRAATCEDLHEIQHMLSNKPATPAHTAHASHELHQDLKKLHVEIKSHFVQQRVLLLELVNQMRSGLPSASPTDDEGRKIDFSRLDELMIAHGLAPELERMNTGQTVDLDGINALLVEHGIFQGGRVPTPDAPDAAVSVEPEAARLAEAQTDAADAAKTKALRPSDSMRSSMRFSFVRNRIDEAQKRAYEAASNRPEQPVIEELELTTATRIMQKIVVSNVFVYLIMGLILVNLLLLGIEIDTAASFGQNDVPTWFESVNMVIVLVFVFEIVLKLLAYGCYEFFRGPDGAWNIFDFFIVALSSVETLIDLWASSLTQVDLSQLRVMRFVRLARTLRGIRVMRLLRYVTALRTLVFSIMTNTMKSLLWTLVLLLLIFYCFGVLLTQIVVDYCRDETIQLTGDANAVPVCGEILSKYWSNIVQSMLTLFMAITGGISWIEALEPLQTISFFAVLFFIFYIIVTVFAVMNVVTGVFCNTAIESANSDKDIAALTQLQKQSTLVRSLRRIFKDMDKENSNMVSIDEFKTSMATRKLSSFLESLGISTQDVWTLFTIIDTDQSGLIDLDEFVSGCMELHGPAKSYQISKMSWENKVTRQAIKQLFALLLDIREHLNMESKSIDFE